MEKALGGIKSWPSSSRAQLLGGSCHSGKCMEEHASLPFKGESWLRGRPALSEFHLQVRDNFPLPAYTVFYRAEGGEENSFLPPVFPSLLFLELGLLTQSWVIEVYWGRCWISICLGKAVAQGSHMSIFSHSTVALSWEALQSHLTWSKGHTPAWSCPQMWGSSSPSYNLRQDIFSAEGKKPLRRIC